MPGGFSYRPGTTTGALTVDPALTGTGSLTLRWTQDFDVPAVGEAVVRVGVTAGSALGDHLASARAYPASCPFTSPTGRPDRAHHGRGRRPAAARARSVGTANNDVLDRHARHRT